MRSRNVSPGRAVMRTTIWSDSTRVPPVTAERSPPDSRITGADSPVMADSSTLAMPSMISPSPGIISPADTTHSSSSWSCGLGTSTSCAVAADVGDRVGAGLAQRVGLRLAPALGHRLGEVGEQHREPQPRGDQAGEEVLRAGRGAEVAEPHDGGEDAADLHDHHHRVARHQARVQLHDGVLGRLRDDRRRPAANATASGSSGASTDGAGSWVVVFIRGSSAPRSARGRGRGSRSGRRR